MCDVCDSISNCSGGGGGSDKQKDRPEVCLFSLQSID